MNTNQIKIFLAAARYKSFSLAAQELFISQSSISYQISNLEAELSLKLFDRDSHEVKLTPAGASFYESMQGLDVFLKNAIQKAQSAEENEHVLSIGFSGESFTRIGAPHISRFSAAYPNVKVTLRKYRYKDGCSPLFQKEVNFMFTYDKDMAGNSSLGFVPLERCGSYLYFSHDSPLARKKHIEESDLSEETLLILDQFENHRPERIDKLINSDLGIKVKQVPDMGVLFLAVASNQGVMISPFVYPTYPASNMASVPFGDYFERYCGLAYRKDDDSPVKQNFIGIITGKKDRNS